jgi:hypothetical protein
MKSMILKMMYDFIRVAFVLYVAIRQMSFLWLYEYVFNHTGQAVSGNCLVGCGSVLFYDMAGIMSGIFFISLLIIMMFRPFVIERNREKLVWSLIFIECYKTIASLSLLPVEDIFLYNLVSRWAVYVLALLCVFSIASQRIKSSRTNETGSE